MNNCEPRKISEMIQTCKLLCNDMVPIVLEGENKFILIKDLINLIIASIGSGNADAFSIAVYAKKLAEEANANSTQALKDLSLALAYATKAYKLACLFEGRLSELEENYMFILNLEELINNLSRLVNLNTLNILKLLNSKVLKIVPANHTLYTVYAFYMDDLKVGEIEVPNFIEYTGSEHIDIDINHRISTKGFANVATSGSYYDLINAPTRLSQFINDPPFITKAEFDTCCDEVKQLIRNLDFRVSLLEECCANMHVDEPFTVLLQHSNVTPQNSLASTSILQGATYSNSFTPKKYYENLLVTCVNTETSLNVAGVTRTNIANGGQSISFVVNENVTVTATATRGQNTVTWSLPAGVTIDGDGSHTDTLSRGTTWTKTNIVIPAGKKVVFTLTNGSTTNSVTIKETDASKLLKIPTITTNWTITGVLLDDSIIPSYTITFRYLGSAPQSPILALVNGQGSTYDGIGVDEYTVTGENAAISIALAHIPSSPNTLVVVETKDANEPSALPEQVVSVVNSGEINLVVNKDYDIIWGDEEAIPTETHRILWAPENVWDSESLDLSTIEVTFGDNDYQYTSDNTGSGAAVYECADGTTVGLCIKVQNGYRAIVTISDDPDFNSYYTLTYINTGDGVLLFDNEIIRSDKYISWRVEDGTYYTEFTGSRSPWVSVLGSRDSDGNPGVDESYLKFKSLKYNSGTDTYEVCTDYTAEIEYWHPGYNTPILGLPEIAKAFTCKVVDASEGIVTIPILINSVNSFPKNNSIFVNDNSNFDDRETSFFGGSTDSTGPWCIYGLGSSCRYTVYYKVNVLDPNNTVVHSITIDYCEVCYPAFDSTNSSDPNSGSPIINSMLEPYHQSNELEGVLLAYPGGSAETIVTYRIKNKETNAIETGVFNPVFKPLGMSNASSLLKISNISNNNTAEYNYFFGPVLTTEGNGGTYDYSNQVVKTFGVLLVSEDNLVSNLTIGKQLPNIEFEAYISGGTFALNGEGHLTIIYSDTADAAYTGLRAAAGHRKLPSLNFRISNE